MASRSRNVPGVWLGQDSVDMAALSLPMSHTGTSPEKDLPDSSVAMVRSVFDLSLAVLEGRAPVRMASMSPTRLRRSEEWFAFL